MAQFSKYNNPKRRKTHRRLDRTEADIIASKMAFDDACNGVKKPLSFYDEQSDKLCGLPSRHIYD